jgi:DNA-binding beta-propeller fold protein YncE
MKFWFLTFILIVLVLSCDKTTPITDVKAITDFSFTNPSAAGTINENAKTIAVIVPHGTDKAALVAAFSTSGASVTVGGAVQVSGTTPNDFTSAVVYTVTAEDGTTAAYTVAVTATAAAREIYVANSGNNTISVFDASAGGDANALRQFGKLTGLSGPQGIAVDTVHNEIFVANFSSDSITVYGRTGSGNIAPTRTISGASTGLSHPQGIAVDTVNNEIVVADNLNDSITVYGRTDSGNIAPIRTISGVSTGLSHPQGIAVDTVNNEIFVASILNDSIRVYGRTDSGNIAPTRIISGASTGLSHPKGIAVDTVNNEILVNNNVANSLNDSIMVYGRTVSGNIAPIRTISDISFGVSYPGSIAVDTVNNEIYEVSAFDIANVGGMIKVYSITVYGRTDSGKTVPVRTISFSSSTGLVAPQAQGITVDTVNNEIFVADNLNDAIKVYSRTDTGNVAPIRSISDASTGLSNPRGIAVDTVNNEIFVGNRGSITVYGRTDSGNIATLRTISGANTGLSGASGFVVDPVHIAVDTVNNEIFVANKIEGAGIRGSITVYGRTDSGNIAPIRAISGVNTGLISGIAVDTINNEIFVCNGGSIMVYGRTDSGNVAPIRTISGTSTSLSDLQSIAVDTVNNEIYVSNGGGSITVHGRTDSGNIAPVRTIAGASTGLSGPRGIAVDMVKNEIFVANNVNGSINVYGRTDSGNTAPLRTISGISTGLSSPDGIALW